MTEGEYSAKVGLDGRFWTISISGLSSGPSKTLFGPKLIFSVWTETGFLDGPEDKQEIEMVQNRPSNATREAVIYTVEGGNELFDGDVLSNVIDIDET